MALKIFVIDDQACIRESLKWYLEDSGHEVVTAAEPLTCEIYQGHMCSQTSPCGHALIIDYRMPGMTGLEFIERLVKRGCKGITANILIISGNTEDIDQARAASLGCSILQKPVSFAELDAWLEEVILRKPSA